MSTAVVPACHPVESNARQIELTVYSVVRKMCLATYQNLNFDKLHYGNDATSRCLTR